ncbi:unnamed protein product [Kluyveromyces dobzhanskii CBS 2104]|uniref:Peptide hydrolase n=1 Tax=Kluyveromyces dobzhanskii CBS 2104 TaxID=1427455 RepID=A0A0A8LAD2_9SACH|nr:unnamed protein product [Kluyveromyces dobzhanskii CBS 2104]
MVVSYLRSAFKFRKTTVSTLFVLTVFAIGLLSWLDANKYETNLPDDKLFESLLETAWHDLQVITEKPHPYTSHFNDDVHDYLLQRVTHISKGSDFIQISDDYGQGISKLFKHIDVFNDSSTDTKLVYYESSNVLVKVEGTNPSLPGLLLSAHFDSVPTSYGATDDGKGVVSLLALLQYYSENQPERTIVFNFNNNEEFGLLGATIFTYNKWFKLVSYVINLEGTGSGSKAVLFRTSDTATALLYEKSVKDQPFGNSIYQQGFYNRFIASETDYKIYEINGLRGWDIAFYKPRDIYHTGKDNVQYTGKAALWHMLSTALQLSKYVVSDEASSSQEILDDEANSPPAIYFDIISKWFFVVSAKQFYVWNIVLLTILPITLILLKFVCDKLGTWKMAATAFFTRLPLSLLASSLFIYFSKQLLTQLNPTVWSRNFLTPFIFFIAEFLTVNATILGLLEYLWPLQDFKTLSLLELTGFTWLLLLKATWDLNSSEFKTTGIYPLTVLYIFMSLASLFGLCTMCFNKRDADEDGLSTYENADSEENGVLIMGSEEEQENRVATETSPLINTPRSSVTSTSTPSVHGLPKAVEYLQKTLNYDWSVQYLLAVPISVYILWQSLFDVLDALAMTVQESSKSTDSVFMFGAYGAIFLCIPLLPFVSKFNRFVVMFLGAVTLLTALFSFTAVPYTETAPVKLRFVQRVYISKNITQSVELYGRIGANMQEMLSSLPSKPVVSCKPSIPGTEMCTYEGAWPNLGAPMVVDVLRNTRKNKDHSEYEPYFADLRINVNDNRNCLLKFNSTDKKLLKQIEFKIGNETKTQSFKTDDGIDSLLLHKIDWDVPYYDIQLKWVPHYNDEVSVDALGVSVDCYWGEFDDTIANGKIAPKVPAYNELLQFLPKYSTVSNRESGMVTVHKYLEL